MACEGESCGYLVDRKKTSCEHQFYSSFLKVVRSLALDKYIHIYSINECDDAFCVSFGFILTWSILYVHTGLLEC